MRNNIVAKSPSDTQYYYGYAFNNAADDDDARRWYKNEKNLIAKAVKNRAVKLKTTKTIHQQIVVSLIEDYYDKELAVYKKLMINAPEKVPSNNDGLITEENLRNFIKDMQKVSEELTLKVTGYIGKNFDMNNPQSAFLGVLNNKLFSEMITGKTTMLSFTAVGGNTSETKNKSKEKQRAKGKEKITRPVSDLINAVERNDSQAIYNALSKIFLLMKDDFDVNNNQWKTVRKHLFDLFQSSIKNDLQVWAKSFYENGKLKRARAGNWTNLVTVEKEVKKIIKEFYRKTINDNYLNQKLKDQHIFMNGAIEVYDKFYDNTYGSEFLYKVIYNGYRGKRTAETEAGDLEYIATAFMKFLKEHVRQFTATKDGQDYVKANEFLTDSNIKKIVKYLTDEKTGSFRNEDPTVFAAFAKSNVNGLLGEIGACVAFSFANKDFAVTYTGREKNRLGRQLGSDMTLKVEDKIMGIQVKNYTTQKNVKLYTQEYKLGTDFKQYLEGSDLQLIRFLIANLPLVERVRGEGNFPNYTIEDIEKFLMVNYTQTFARSKDLQSNKKVEVAFYYVNNVITPFTLILANQILELMTESSSSNFKFEESTLPELFEAEPGESYRVILNANPVSFATQKAKFYEQTITNGDVPTINKNLAAITLSEGLYYPNRLTQNNIVANVKFKFKGIALR